jgi:hypothetical protein
MPGTGVDSLGLARHQYCQKAGSLYLVVPPNLAILIKDRCSDSNRFSEKNKKRWIWAMCQLEK